MSIIDEVVRANREAVEHFTHGDLPNTPNRKLAVLSCMDSRLTVEQMLGLKTGDAHIIRNAGAVVTEDALRSLLISHYMLGTQEFMIIAHTGCGMVTFTGSDLRKHLQHISGTATVTPAQFHTFTELDQSVREQVQKLRSHPWVPTYIPVRGFIYDVKTGLLDEVLA